MDIWTRKATYKSRPDYSRKPHLSICILQKMVQIHYSVLFIASLAVLGFAAPSSKRTVPQVEADIKNINVNVVALNNALNAFPNSGGTLSQALVSANRLLFYQSRTHTYISGHPQQCNNCGEFPEQRHDRRYCIYILSFYSSPL